MDTLKSQDGKVGLIIGTVTRHVDNLTQNFYFRVNDQSLLAVRFEPSTQQVNEAEIMSRPNKNIEILILNFNMFVCLQNTNND